MRRGKAEAAAGPLRVGAQDWAAGAAAAAGGGEEEREEEMGEAVVADLAWAAVMEGLGMAVVDWETVAAMVEMAGWGKGADSKFVKFCLSESMRLPRLQRSQSPAQLKH